MPSAIVTTHYRYKRPPRKKKPAMLEVPTIIRKGAKPSATPAGCQPVTIGRAAFGDRHYQEAARPQGCLGR